MAIIGEPSDLRALISYGDVAQRSQEGIPVPEAVKRVPSVLEMLGKDEGGRDTTAAGKATSANKAAEAISKQKDGTPTLHTECGEGKNLRFKAKRRGGLEIVSDLDGTGKESKCQETDAEANFRRQSLSKRLLISESLKWPAKTPALLQRSRWQRRGYRLFSIC